MNSYNYTKGWVLLDFPNDVESAKAYEKKFTGIISPSDKINLKAEQLKKETKLIVLPTEK